MIWAIVIILAAVVVCMFDDLIVALAKAAEKKAK